jgi:hypothetical protein
MTFDSRGMLTCDEIRHEIGGKQLIIGAYSGVILLPFLPFLLPQLTIRFEVKVDKQHYDHVESTILRPNGSIFRHDSMSLDVKYPEYPTSVVFLLGGLNFEHTGKYGVLLAMDGPPLPIGNFSILTWEEISQGG